MPPFINVDCTYQDCKKHNRFDLAELKTKDGSFTKDIPHWDFEENCQYCGRKFEFVVER